MEVARTLTWDQTIKSIPNPFLLPYFPDPVLHLAVNAQDWGSVSVSSPIYITATTKPFPTSHLWFDRMEDTIGIPCGHICLFSYLKAPSKPTTLLCPSRYGDSLMNGNPPSSALRYVWRQSHQPESQGARQPIIYPIARFHLFSMIVHTWSLQLLVCSALPHFRP